MTRGMQKGLLGTLPVFKNTKVRHTKFPKGCVHSAYFQTLPSKWPTSNVTQSHHIWFLQLIKVFWNVTLCRWVSDSIFMSLPLQMRVADPRKPEPLTDHIKNLQKWIIPPHLVVSVGQQSPGYTLSEESAERRAHVKECGAKWEGWRL